MKIYNSIKKFYNYLNKRPDINIINFEIVNKNNKYYSFFIYTKSTNICCALTDTNVLITVEKLFAVYYVVDIVALICCYDGKPDEFYIYLTNYYDILDIKAHIIQTAWKKYRYNVFKKRRDPLKRDLVEYIYHPKRLTFNV
jgi:hypothetical protein